MYCPALATFIYYSFWPYRVYFSPAKTTSGYSRAAGLAIAGIALYHVGVEQAWWAGPSGCSSNLDTSDLASLTDALLAAPMVKCDEIAWSFIGLSMAGWHMLASLALSGLALAGYMKARASTQ